ncbi:MULTISPECIES: hypothetical protein [Falsihalocynthiibacter]
MFYNSTDRRCGISRVGTMMLHFGMRFDGFRGSGGDLVAAVFT